MVTVIVFALVVAVWWFKGTSDGYEESYIKEKSKNENFSEVVKLLKMSEANFTETKVKSNHTVLSKTFTEPEKSFIIFTENENLKVQILLKAEHKYDKKYFTFSIYEIPSNVVNIVLSQSKEFQIKFDIDYKEQLLKRKISLLSKQLKTLSVVILIIFNTNAYSQSYSEKWNNLENRYEYFNSNGNMIGYKSYDNLNRQWNYYEVKQQPLYTPTSSVNLPLVQQVLASKQNAYNQNSLRISNAVNDMKSWLSNAKIDNQTKEFIRFSFNKFYLEPLYAKGYDLSDTAFVNQIIQSLYDSFDKTVRFEVDRARN